MVNQGDWTNVARSMVSMFITQSHIINLERFRVFLKDMDLNLNLFIRLVSFLWMIWIAQMLVAMVAIKMVTLTMVKVRGKLLFTVVVAQVSRLRFRFPPSDTNPASISMFSNRLKWSEEGELELLME